MGIIFDKTCEYAIKKHSNQLRKDGTLYILHPFEAVSIAGTMTNDEEVLAATMLHDVVEDTNTSIEEIHNMFGDKIFKLVSYETESKYPNLSKEESWIKRKSEIINRLEETNDINFKIIYLSDKLSNIRSLYRDYNQNGIKAFDKFNVKDPSIQSWYYFKLLDALKELEQYDAYKEFKDKIDIIFEEERKKNDGKNNYTI